jgi:hypothetical protein
MPLKIATMFYSSNGVPLDEDNTRDANNLYNLRTAQDEHQFYIKSGRTTVDLHFDREPRFYAWVGFDGGIWFRIEQANMAPSQLWHLGLKIGETDGSDGWGNPTGYLPKKLIPFETQVTAINAISTIPYAWPIIRLADLYLLYVEALNETEGPNGTNSAKLFFYIDEVRKRAGLKGVKESWGQYSTKPRKYSTKEGMREIIQQERLIELCLEGHRFWDIRRWKTAFDIYSTPLQGWFMNASITDGTESEVNQIMYTPQLLYVQKFGNRDYFWPIANRDLNVNTNLVQNIGW